MNFSRLPLLWLTWALVACGSSSPSLATSTSVAGAAGAPLAGAGGVAGSSGIAGSGGLSGEAGVGGEQAGGALQGGAGASALGGLGGGGGASGGGLGGAGSGGSGGAVDPALCKSFWIKPAYGEGKPLWRDTQGFQVFSEFGAEDAPDRFALITLSPDDGEQILHRVYDVVPTEAKGSFFSVQDLTYDDQGNFAVLFLWRHSSENFSHTLLLFASTGSDSFTVIKDPVDLSQRGQTISRTQNGFFVQYVNYAGTLSHPIEYAADGKLLKESKTLPAAMVLDWYTTDKSVEPTTHDVWQIADGAPAPYLWGFHSDGTAFPQPSPTSFFGLDQGPCSYGSSYTAIAPTSTGALAVWKGNKEICAQEVGLDLKTLGPPLPILVPDQPSPTSNPFFYTRLASQRVGNRWWIAALEQRALRSIWLEDGQVLSNDPLVVHSPAACLTSGTCAPGMENIMKFDVRILTPIPWKDELWVGFNDASGYKKEKQDVYHIVKVVPGCVYPSRYDFLQ